MTRGKDQPPKIELDKPTSYAIGEAFRLLEHMGFMWNAAQCIRLAEWLTKRGWV